jgi:hypothetical protein
MSKDGVIKTWILANIFGAMVNVVLIFVEGLLTTNVKLEYADVVNLFAWLIILSFLGMILSLPHFIFIYVKIANHKIDSYFGLKSNAILFSPYLLSVIIVMLINDNYSFLAYFSSAFYYFLKIALIHLFVGIFFWKYFFKKAKTTK